MDDNKLTIINDEGEETATILFTFEDNEKNYVIFELDETKEISAAIFIPDENGDEGELLDIETEEEWQLIEEVLEEYFNEEDID